MSTDDLLYNHRTYWNVVNLHGDVLLNLTNMFCGYKEDRLYSFIPYVCLLYTSPALSLDTSKLTLEESVNRLLELVLPKVKSIK